ncbi:cell division protein FtsK, partial [Streptomyces diastaticus]
RDWPDASPTLLQEPAYVGVAVMKTYGRKGFTRLRTPYVGEDDSAHVAALTAHLTADPADLLAAQLPGIDLTKDDPDDDSVPPLAA